MIYSAAYYLVIILALNSSTNDINNVVEGLKTSSFLNRNICNSCNNRPTLPISSSYLPTSSFSTLPSTSSSPSSSSSSLNSVPDWLTEEQAPPNDIEKEFQPPSITVRFINTPSGKDVITVVEEGSNLLIVGDNAGVKLPRACRTGLCGSCTCEVQDPAAIITSSNPREGFATIRACSSKCFVPEGMSEMVVDVERMRSTSKPKGGSGGNVANADYSDPMARFSGDWEKEFRPQWEMTKQPGVGQMGGASDPRANKTMCAKCVGKRRVTCYTCNGDGRVKMADGSLVQCAICVGMRTVGCGYCRGTGNSIKKQLGIK